MPLTRIFLLFLFTFLSGTASAQSYYSYNIKAIPGGGQELRDTIQISGLDFPFLTNNFGLDSITLNLENQWNHDLVISLIAPDGTTINLSEQDGGYSGSNFTNTCFDQEASYVVTELNSPFSGKMRPVNSVSNMNNGQPGNGIWQLRILNKAGTFGHTINWGLHFNTTPALPVFTSTQLPLIVINTVDNITIPWLSYMSDAEQKVNAHMGITYQGNGLPNSLSDPFNHYSGNIEIKARGASSLAYPQKSYKLNLVDNNGNDINMPLLGMPAEEDWILYAPWNDKTLMRNVLTYGLSARMGRYAARTRFCELVLNGDYRGVYVLMENVKRDNNRVAINKLEANDSSETVISGGYIFKVDWGWPNDPACWLSAHAPCVGGANTTAFTYVYPKAENITIPQKEYIASYVDSFETALLYHDLYDTVSGYRKYIDVASFIDFSLIQELSNNGDAYRLSSFFYKPRSGRLNAGPVWDFNVAFGNAYYLFSWATDNFRWDLPCPSGIALETPFWWKRFLQDSTYVNELKCRYLTLRTNAFSMNYITSRIDSYTALLDNGPAQRHFARWPLLGKYVEPNIYIGGTWQDELEYLKNWIDERILWLDQEWGDSPCNMLSVQAAGVQSDGLSIYPNPSSGEITIISPDNIRHLTIFSITGSELLSVKDAGKSVRVDLSVHGIIPGTYYARALTDNGIHNTRFIIME